MVISARMSASRRRRLMKLIERDLYLAVQQPAGALIIHIQPVKALDVHPQRQQAPTRCVRHVHAELTHTGHAGHSFGHPTDDVTTDRRRTQLVICTAATNKTRSPADARKDALQPVNYGSCCSNDFRGLPRLMIFSCHLKGNMRLPIIKTQPVSYIGF